MASSDTDTPAPDQPSLRRLLRDTLVFTLVIVIGVALAGYFLREPLQSGAEWLIDQLGYVGMFIGVFAADAFTFPLPPDTYLFLSIASGADVVLTLISCASASVVAGHVAYLIGPWIERIPLLKDRLESFRSRGEYLFREWGGWAVGIAAMTPVPFSIVSWLAGIYRMNHGAYALAALMRVPRIVGYYGLYRLGWAPAL